MFDISEEFKENRLMVDGPNGGTCLYLSQMSVSRQIVIR
jgi:hypothetical protein